MPSTFFGLNIAYTGLQAANAWLNTTGNNIANVETEGYSRQQVTQQAADALRLRTSYGMAGSGVTAVSIDQIRNEYYDLKYWNSNSTLGIYEERKSYMYQIEDYFNETDTMRGFNTIYSEMFSGLDEVFKSAGDNTVKEQFLGQAGNLCNYFSEMSTNLRKLQEDANAEVKNVADQINSIASQIAALNKQINLIECNKVVANELRDNRSLLIDELSRYVDTEVQETPIYTEEGGNIKSGMNNYTVYVGGQILVDKYEYNTLDCTPRDYKVNQSDAEGLYDLRWSNGLDFNIYGKNRSGQLKGLIDIRDGNNDEYFHGTVKGTTTTNVTDENGDPVYELNDDGTRKLNKDGDPIQKKTYTITVDVSKYQYLQDIKKLTLDASGEITLGNKIFNYSDWSYDGTTDPEHPAFTLTVDEDPTDYKDKEASIGASVDYQGIPYYQEQMNEWVRSFAAAMNDIEMTAKDQNGNYAKGLFLAKMTTGDDCYDFISPEKGTPQYKDETDPSKKESNYSSTGNNYYQLTASNLVVNPDMVYDVSKFLTRTTWSDGQDTQDIAEQLMTVKNDKSRMSFRGCSSQEFLQTITADIALNTSAAVTFEKNYTDINHAVENQRQSVMGVDNDEEALNLVKFREAYNLAAKMMSVMQEIYDKLINGTGV